MSPQLVWPHGFDAFTAEADDPFRAVTRLHDDSGIIWTSGASYGHPGSIVMRYDLLPTSCSITNTSRASARA